MSRNERQAQGLAYALNGEYVKTYVQSGLAGAAR